LRDTPGANAKAVDAAAVDAAAADAAVAPPAPSHQTEADSAQKIADMSWPQLQQSIAACRKCPRCEMRRHAVPGAGDAKANWLFIGAAPETDDSPHAAPLAGAAQTFFTNMLQAIELAPDANVYMTTLVKCRASDDRAPTADEIAACRPYLERQIALLQPCVIVALGDVPAATLLERDASTPLSAMRGGAHHYGAVPLIVTHDPRHLLLKTMDKRDAWNDLCMARDRNATRT
jgi:uracil-DNA glycosylase family 4